MTETATAGPLGRRIPQVLHDRHFRRWYAGQSLSILGDGIVPVALAFAVLSLGGRASDLGVVLAAGMVPSILFVLVGGVVADRVDRRRLMLACDLVRFASQGAQGLLLLTGHANLATLMVLQFVWGTGSAFFRPASTGLIAELVPAARLQQANGLLGLSENLAYTIGPATSGLLVALLSPGVALLVDAATFAASATALALIRTPARVGGASAAARRGSMLADLHDGWREFRSRSWLWSMVLWAGTFHLLALPAMLVLGPAVARAQLGGAPAWAAIATGSGVGAIVGGVIALRYHPRHLLRASFLPLGLYGLALVALAVPLSTPWIVAAAILGGIGVAMFNVYFYTAIQQQVPLEALSRVASYDWLGSIATLPIGMALIGPVAAWTSTAGVLVAAGVWMLLSPALLYAVRSARTLESVPEEATHAPHAAPPAASHAAPPTAPPAAPPAASPAAPTAVRAPAADVPVPAQPVAVPDGVAP